MPTSTYRKKIFPALTAVFAGMAVFSAFTQVAYAGTLTVSITADAATCTSGGGTVLLRMSGATNAHAELPSQANYAGNVVCGNNVTGLGNSCSGTFATVLKLSGTSNAHVEQNSQANYANNACISVSSGSVSVGYQATNCTGFDTTIGSMSGVTNAHIGNSAAYPSIQICATAVGVNPPTLTSYTNDTDTTLNSANCATTGCGARIGTGAFKQTFRITGTNFGADPGVANRRNSTNNVKIGTYMASTTAWSNTEITVTTELNGQTPDTDTDWGSNFGGTGTNGVTVTAGGATSGGLEFYVYPQIIGVRNCDSSGFPVGSKAREYDATDAACPNGATDGEVFLDGTRFGTGSTGGAITVVGTSATPSSWANTLIKAQVPPAIGDSTYTGNLIVQQGTGSNNKTHTYTGFRVLPRITSFTPTSGTYGDSVDINGNHFCENGGTCPTVFGTNDKVTFTSSIDATAFTSWTDTLMRTQVPNSSATGNVVLKSNTYTSNGKSFTVVTPTPSDPTSMNQYRNSGLTNAIATGGAASSTPVYLTMSMVTGVSGGTLYPQIEYKAIGTGFACTGTSACGSATEGTGVAGPGPINCNTPANNCAIAVSPADNVYHWQARVRHNKNSIDYYSAWVPFVGGATEGDTDFKIDTTAPAITNVTSNNPTPGSNSATIEWSTADETSTSQVQYQAVAAASCPSFSFAATCSSNNDCTAINATPVYSPHTTVLANLNSGTDYCFRVRSKDAAGNESISSNNSFQTQSVTQPAKTVTFVIVGSTGTVTNAAPLSQTFTVVMPENATSTKSSFIMLTGIYETTTPDPATTQITIQYESETARTYTLPGSPSGTLRSYFKIIHPVNAVNTTSVSTLTVTPVSPTMLYTSSAELVVTYAYTP